MIVTMSIVIEAGKVIEDTGNTPVAVSPRRADIFKVITEGLAKDGFEIASLKIDESRSDDSLKWKGDGVR